jgi:hypothetical protein
MRHFAVNCSSAAKTVLDDGQVENYGISDEDVSRYQSYLLEIPEATIDL